MGYSRDSELVVKEPAHGQRPLRSLAAPPVNRAHDKRSDQYDSQECPGGKLDPDVPSPHSDLLHLSQKYNERAVSSKVREIGDHQVRGPGAANEGVKDQSCLEDAGWGQHRLHRSSGSYSTHGLALFWRILLRRIVVLLSASLIGSTPLPQTAEAGDNLRLGADELPSAPGADSHEKQYFHDQHEEARG